MAETRRQTFCGSPEHAVDRRGFLGTLAAGAAALAADMTALDVLKAPALAGELKRRQKHVILLWLAGRLQPARDLGPQARRRRPAARSGRSRRRSPASRSPS